MLYCRLVIPAAEPTATARHRAHIWPVVLFIAPRTKQDVLGLLDGDAGDSGHGLHAQLSDRLAALLLRPVLLALALLVAALLLVGGHLLALGLLALLQLCSSSSASQPRRTHSIKCEMDLSITKCGGSDRTVRQSARRRLHHSARSSIGSTRTHNSHIKTSRCAFNHTTNTLFVSPEDRADHGSRQTLNASIQVGNFQ